MTARRPGPANTAPIWPRELTNASGDRVLLDAALDEVMEEVGQELRQSLWSDGVQDYEAITMRTLARLYPRLRHLSPTTHATDAHDQAPA